MRAKPLGGGARLLGNLELRFPLVWLLEGALFVDAGNASNSWQSMRPVYGVGPGIRWRSPVGPVSARRC